MILLTSTTQSVELVTGNNQSVDWIVSWVDITDSTFTPNSTDGNVAAATTTTLVAAPANATQRQVKHISVRVAGASTNTVTIQKNSGGTARTVFKVSLATGEQLQYTDGEGFRVFDANGNLKVTTTPGGGSNINVSAGTTSNNLTAFTLSNSNNVSFGLNGSVITASVAAGGGGLTNIRVSAGTTSQLLSALTLSDSNGISFGINGSVITASHNGLTNIRLSAGTTSNLASAFTFSNSNNVSFGLNAGVVTGSASFAQSNQQMTMFATGNTTQSSSGTSNASSLIFNGAGIVSVGITNGSVVISATGGGGGIGAIAGGTQTATSGTIVFSDSNGISFGLLGSTRMTASHNGITSQTNQQMTIFATGNTTQSSSGTSNASSLVFRGDGIASVGVINGSVLISVPAGGGGLTNINLSAGTTSNNLSAFTLSNANNVSFGLNGSVVTGSASFPAQTNQTLGLYASSNTTLTSSGTADARSLSFRGIGGVTVGVSASEVLISGAQTVAQTNQTIGGYAVGNTTAQSSSSTMDARSLSFSGLGIASVGYSAGAVVISVPAGGGAAGTNTLGMSNLGNTVGTSGVVSGSALQFVLAGGNNVTLSQSINGSSATITISAFNQTNQTLGLYALGNTTQNSSTTFDARTLGSFNALGAMTMGFSNGSIQVSAPATSSLSATGQVSISTNGSTISIGVPAAFTKSRFNPFMEAVGLASQIGSNTLHFHPVPDPDNFQFDRLIFDLTVNQTGTSGSGGLTISMWAGLYTRNASTLSLLASQSVSRGFTVSSTNSTIHNGPRIFSMGWTSTITQADLWLGIVSRTTTSGTNQFGGISQYVASDISEAFSGHLGSANNATNQNVLGLGIYSATTTGIPGSVAFSQINGTGANIQRVPMYYFLSQTA